TMILATMVLVWALLYFPYRDAAGQPYEQRIAAEEDKLAQAGTTVKETEEAITGKLKEWAELKAAGGDPAPMEKLLQDGKDLEAQVQPVHAIQQEWKSCSYLGQLGHGIEPAVRPLGWDWKIGVAALASFPAREVVVGTLGILFTSGKVDADDIRD